MEKKLQDLEQEVNQLKQDMEKVNDRLDRIETVLNEIANELKKQPQQQQNLVDAAIAKAIESQTQCTNAMLAIEIIRALTPPIIIRRR